MRIVAESRRLVAPGRQPVLERPIPGVQTLAFEPYRVDLTPFAGLLDDGESHTIALGVFNAQDHFSVTANLLLYLDHGKDQLTGAVTGNTLAAPSPQATSSVNGSVTSVNVSSNRQFTISGTLNTSRGTVNTQITQALAFSNAQQFTITDTVYHQHVVQATTIDSTTTTTNGKRPRSCTSSAAILSPSTTTRSRRTETPRWRP